MRQGKRGILKIGRNGEREINGRRGRGRLVEGWGQGERGERDRETGGKERVRE